MSTTQPSATPRTDALILAPYGNYFSASATDFRNLARTLETELAAASQAYDCLFAIHGTVLADLARLRAELANQKVQNNHNWQFQEISEEALKRAERAEAALAAARKDSERLDWLERNVQEVGFERMNERVLGGCSFDRNAIDAAMTNSNQETT